MTAIFSSAAGLFITIPFLFYILLFTIIKQITKNHRLALNSAINATTFVLIISVHLIILTIWDRSFLALIILVMLVLAIMFTFYHWKTKEEIHYRKVFIGFWRFNFLVFSLLYVSLILFGVISRAKEALTV
ncbi:DUF3397 domain-containing protein [Siminovitchia sp. FSL H7-0308]|uniref:DUF3397 domain-containing protein n=1 Tax=Siminovitchia thermophila TaxID=1245522 RepID=A0ABS2R7D6_9BACI|nr:DUF3397 domain-containing protein [Siminovitchia thermophila]MBM7715570.1 hypothetical protein [Siminovitchia thermophila]ONK23332.1 hypothetical protein BLX87_12030 [Bacillus sp. VT-16-64]